MPLLTCDPSSLQLAFTAELEAEEVATLRFANHDDGMSPGVCPSGWNGNVAWSLKPASRTVGKKYVVTPASGVLMKDASAEVKIARKVGQTSRSSDSFTLSMERTILTKAPESEKDWRAPSESPVTVVLKQKSQTDAKKKAAVEAKKKADAGAKRKAKAKADAKKKGDDRRKSEHDSTPCLHYFPFAGRGELTRMIAAAGGLQIEESADDMDRSSFGSPGGLPCLAHGKLKLCQSFAIERYIAQIAPNFAALTPAERAIDDMFCKIKEDMLQRYADILMAVIGDEGKKATAPEEIAVVGDRWFPVIEGRLPADGFINGRSFPTAGDLAVLNISRAFMPFGAAYMVGGYDAHELYPLFAAHADRVAEEPAVQEYLQQSISLESDPFNIAAGYDMDGGSEAPESSMVASENEGQGEWRGSHDRRRDSCCHEIDEEDMLERQQEIEAMMAELGNDESDNAGQTKERTQEQHIFKPDTKATTFWPSVFGSCCRKCGTSDKEDVSDAQASISQVADEKFQ